MDEDRTCPECGQRFDAAETVRMYGEEFADKHPEFCSTDCYRNSLAGPDEGED